MKCSLGISNFLEEISAAATAAKSLQSCPTLCDPIAHQASRSLGFSRQEHWRGWPFPSPMQESEKWKGSCSVMSDFSWPDGLQPTRLLHPWGFPGKSTGVGCHHLLQEISSLSHLLFSSISLQKKNKNKNKKTGIKRNYISFTRELLKLPFLLKKVESRLADRIDNSY